MDGVGVVAVLHQGGREFLCFVLGTTEDDTEEFGVRIEEALQCGEAVFGVYYTILVVDRGGGGVRRADAHLFGLAHVALRNAAHIVAHGGAEEPRAFVGGCALQDLREILLETHVEHLIGLVEHHDVHGAEVDSLAADHVQKAARCGHNDLRAALDVADLIADARTTVHGHHAGAFHVLREFLEVLADLHAQLARGCQHQGLYCAVRGIQEFQHGQAEGSGLTSAGLRQGYHILLAAHEQGNGLLLNGSWGGEPDVLEGTKDLRAETERVERCHLSSVEGGGEKCAAVARNGAQGTPERPAIFGRLRHDPTGSQLQRHLPDHPGAGGGVVGVTYGAARPSCQSEARTRPTAAAQGRCAH